jgi:two-component system LytT family response regulator
MRNFFLRTLPQEDGGNWLNVGLVAGAIVFFILLFFRPFGLGQYQGNVLAVSLAFAAWAFVGTLIYGWIVYKPWMRHTRQWQVWQECVAIMLLLCLISIGNCILDSIWFGSQLSWIKLLAYNYSSFLIGIPVTLTIVALEYQRQLRNQLAALLQKDIAAQTGRTITFHDTSVKGEDLTMPMTDFLYAEAQKNFVDIYFLREGRVEHHQLRATLASVLADANDKSIFQCHRSFIVNHILSAHGNSNGYQLTVGDDRHVVPVSRSYVAKLRSFVG